MQFLPPGGGLLVDGARACAGAFAGRIWWHGLTICRSSDRSLPGVFYAWYDRQKICYCNPWVTKLGALFVKKLGLCMGAVDDISIE